MTSQVDLTKYTNPEYDPGASLLKRWLWLVVSEFIFRPYWVVLYRFKVFILRIFGAKIGVGVYIKPNVLIKAPWKLEVGNHTWIGEGVWIDNVAPVQIGSHCCISQSALIETGNHDFTHPHFILNHAPVVIQDGVWIGAGCLVCPGVQIGTHSVLSAGSVATQNILPYSIYQGNPATFKKKREIIDKSDRKT